MVHSGQVLIVSGPPGGGKSTVAEALASGADRGVHLESDWFYRCIQAGFVGPHLPEAQSQNEVVMDIVADAAAGFATAGYTVVWDGIVGPWFLDRIAVRLASRGVSLRYLVLRPSRIAALERVSTRDGTTDLVGASTMFDKFVDLGRLECHVVDSDATPSVVLERVSAVLADDGFGWIGPGDATLDR